MSADWPRVPLGEVASPVERWERPMPGKTYRQIGVRLWGEGAYERESIDGADTKYAALNRVEDGDIIVNKIWARNGSVAVVSESLAGCYGSGEFPTFSPKRTLLDPRWVHWLTKTRNFWDQCDQQSRGTSGKNRIRPDAFLRIMIPLPPLAEQRRIVARVEAIAARVTEARRLREEISIDVGRLCRSILRSNGSDLIPTPMSELVRLREPDVVVEREKNYPFAGVYCFGRGVFKGQIKKGIEFSYDRLTTLRAGDFVYPKLMAWEGALAVVPRECEGLVVSTEFPVFRIDTNRVLPEVLDVYFRDPSVWPELSGQSTGTNVRRRRLNPSDFLNYPFPLPTRESQERLRLVVNKFNMLRPLQAEMMAELDALLPAVLNRAFAGEL